MSVGSSETKISAPKTTVRTKPSIKRPHFVFYRDYRYCSHCEAKVKRGQEERNKIGAPICPLCHKPLRNGRKDLGMILKVETEAGNRLIYEFSAPLTEEEITCLLNEIDMWIYTNGILTRYTKFSYVRDFPEET